MSYLLPHLHSGYAVDQAILSVRGLPISLHPSLLSRHVPLSSFSLPLPVQEEARVVVLRFGHDWDETCMQMDEVLSSVAEKMKNFAVVYLVDISEVPDFNAMYELYDPCTIMFFFRNKVSGEGREQVAGRGLAAGWCIVPSPPPPAPPVAAPQSKEITLRINSSVPRAVPLQHEYLGRLRPPPTVL